MIFRRLVSVLFFVLALAALGGISRADGPVPYETFVKDATPSRGLFTIWHKDGKVYLELAPSQLDTDFIQTIVPSSGLGGRFVVYGNTDHLPTELVRFERAGNSVAILWPNPYFVAPHSPAAQRAIAGNFPRTIVGLAPIAAVDAKSGAIVIDAAPFLDDQLDLKDVLKQGLHDDPKSEPYVLDRDHSYFGITKAFPQNVVLEALQSWTSDDQKVDDVLPDPRHLQMRVTYNLAQAPDHPDYRPRYADDRVGIYDDIYLSFDNDEVLSRELRYIVRWNLQPSDPTKAVSPAKHPMVFYLSDTIPEKYRAPIRAAVLKWNGAFLKLGISDALQVLDQPKDPDWDPDDIRYNVLRWVTEYQASFGADSQTLYDPRTGEEFRTGILISADVPLYALHEWKYVVDPARYGRTTDPMPEKYLDDVWLATIMHETGHNLGMQHNFIGSRAYTAKELQDQNFTGKYGVASTVMEYAPINIWPKGTPQGDFSQTVLGPYDYYAMHWAYGAVPGAATPEDEIPTLSKWASAWSDPMDRYASDEDISWQNGHAADPRVEQGILTNDPLGWCAGQLALDRDLMMHLDERFPAAGEAYEAETDAFHMLYGRYAQCAEMPTHFIGGQYLSRAHRGDPGAEPPVVPVPRAVQYRAFQMLDAYLFSATAWRLRPALLAHLGYSEWSGYGYVGFEGYGNLPKWSYDPPLRHDVAYAEGVAKIQSQAIAQMFLPVVLARIADGASESTAPGAMRLEDLFAWMHAGVFGELGQPATRTIGPMRRTLQQNYLATLVALVTKPQPGTPADATALARADLQRVVDESAKLLRAPGLDATTRAHVDLLRARAHAAVEVSLVPR
jgi:hypothetical protein